MGKKFDQRCLNGLLATVTLWDDDRDFIVETLGGLPGSLLRRLMASPVQKNGGVECSMTLPELRKIINGLFTVALCNEDIEEDANRIAERLLVCEHGAIEAMVKRTQKGA